MDNSEFALQLIKAYNKEFNRYKRAKAAQQRIYADATYIEEMKAKGFNPYLRFNHSHRPRNYDRKQLRNCFQTNSNLKREIPLGFVSAAIKSRDVAEITAQLAFMVEAGTARDVNGNFHPLYTDKLNEKERISNIPVYAELGKRWRELVDACCDERDAYEDRWAARCAIKAFNKMNTGVEIKFGNCGHKGGSMSYIRFVVIDGYHMPLKKFLENSEFEAAVLVPLKFPHIRTKPDTSTTHQEGNVQECVT